MEKKKKMIDKKPARSRSWWEGMIQHDQADISLLRLALKSKIPFQYSFFFGFWLLALAFPLELFHKFIAIDKLMLKEIN